MSRRPIFLDRDGVINHDLKPYIVSAEQIELIDGSREAIVDLYNAGFDIYVASNQQGVGKGVIPAEELPRMSERIQSLLRPHGAEIRHFEYCTALASDNDPCRKPAPGMILSMRERFSLALEGAFLIGDRWSDIEAGARAGLRPLLVYTGITSPGEENGWEYPPEKAFRNLREAADFVLDIR